MIMTGSSSDDWILLALRLQPFLNALSHNANAITSYTNAPHTSPLCLNLHSQFTNCSELHCTALHWYTTAHLKSSNQTSRFLPRLSLNANSPLWTPNSLLSLSLSYITTDGESASLSWYQAPFWGSLDWTFPSLYRPLANHIQNTFYKGKISAVDMQCLPLFCLSTCNLYINCSLLLKHV
jgi:hypothetical protein